jgi:GMP synthase (glutamine-hydrolysing)
MWSSAASVLSTTPRYPIAKTHLYAQPELPALDDFDWLIVLGGPMGANDDNRYPWLIQEKQLIDAAIRAEKKVLGICLGAQLVARVLGANVRRNDHKEIGWFPLTFTDEALGSFLFKNFPRSLNVMHWHGDTFDLPPEYTRIASSQACLNQGFMSPDRNILALQFHMEWDREMAETLIQNCADDLQEGSFVQNPAEILAPPEQFNMMNEGLFRLLDTFAIKP